MKITILAGSPKGELSVTMQYVNYIMKKHPEHDYTVFHVAQKIKKIEKDEKAFSEIIESVKTSDALLWAFPLYYLVVHSGMKRFIELIFERRAKKAFKNKYAASLSGFLNPSMYRVWTPRAWARASRASSSFMKVESGTGGRPFSASITSECPHGWRWPSRRRSPTEPGRPKLRRSFDPCRLPLPFPP